MAKPTLVSSKEQLDGILGSSRVVVADFFADWCAPCRQIAPLYESLCETVSRPNSVTFVKINNDNNKDLAKEFGITALPTFLVFRNGKVSERVQGANLTQLKGVVEKLVAEIIAGEIEASGSGSGAAAGGPWQGADIPRGYGDVSDQIEIKGCELLNADEDAGPVRALFETTKPSALGQGKGTAKDWVQSGADDQLLLYVPFQSTIKLHTLQITSLPPKDQDDVARPAVIHLYINRPQNMDFSEADDTEPTQAITLTSDDWNADGTASVPLRFVKFQKTVSLVIYVQKADNDAELVRLDRVKLIGEAGAKRDPGKLQKVGDDDE